MKRWIKRLGWFLGGLVVVLVVAFFALQRSDIPYATLEARYATTTSHYVDLPGGVRAHYRDEGNRAGPVIVLVHGFSASTLDWDPWATRLGERYRIIAVDLPGHGLTRAPTGYASSSAAQVGVVDALATTLGLKSFVIGGNSMGGGVAWRYALTHGDRLNGLILVDAAGWPRQGDGKNDALIFKLLANPIARPIIKNLDNSALTKQGLEAAFIDKSLVTPDLVRRYTDFSRAPGHRDILIARPDFDYATARGLAAIKVPTLILFGADDRLIPSSDARRFGAAIPGATVIVYPGVGHVPMEQIPDKSAADVRSWLTTHGAG